MVIKRIEQNPVRYWDKAVISVFPLILATLNSNWIFTPVTNFIPDPWFYLGYFRYFYDYVPEYPSSIHYFVERITWNVPGYYVYHLLPPLQANSVLHLLVCYLALFSLYGTLNLLYGHRTALTTTLLMGGYPWFLRAAGWDYIDGIGIAHMLLLLFLLTKAANSQRWRVILFLAGAVHASLLITNLFWVGFAPSWLAYFVLIKGPISKERVWKLIGEASYFLLGNLLLVLTIAVFYHSLTGNYFFLQNSIRVPSQHSHDDNLIRFISIFFGAMPPYWHMLALLVAIVSIPHLINPDRIKHLNAFMATTVLFVVTYGCLIFWHYNGWPYLIVFLYSSFAIPAIFLLLGAHLANVIESLPNRLFHIIISTTLFALILIFRLVVIFPSLEHLQGNPTLLVACGLILILLLLARRKDLAILPIMLSFVVLFFLTASNSYVLLADPQKGKDNFVAIIESSDTIDAYYPEHHYKEFRLWFREDKNYNTFFSLSALYLYPWGSAIDRPASGRIPSSVLSFRETDEFHYGDHIVIVSSNPSSKDVLAEADQALTEKNLRLELEKTTIIHQGDVLFHLYFTHAYSYPAR